LTELEADAARLDEYRSELATLRGQFPTSLELSSFTRHLSQMAEAAGLVVRSVQVGGAAPVDQLPVLPPAPDGTEPPEVPTPPPGLYLYPITLTIAGPLAAAEQYMDALQGEGPETRMFLAPRMTWSEAAATTPEGEPAEVFTIDGMTFALVPLELLPEPTGTDGSAGEESDIQQGALP
jgi:hypothetical protein